MSERIRAVLPPARLALLTAVLTLLAPPADALGRPQVRVGADGVLRVVDAGRVLLAESPAERLGFRSEGRWHRATGLVQRSRRTAELTTDDPDGRTLRVELTPAQDARIRVLVLGEGPRVEAVGVGFRTRRGERYLGFGERSNAVDQRGNEVENYVQEGPYLAEEYPLVETSVPDWALFRRPDATYFPMPWLLSTGGFGVLVGSPERSVFRLGSRNRNIWSVEVEASQLGMTIFGGRPASLVRQLTRLTGRQPPPAAPWLFGPWFQTGHQNTAPDEQSYVRLLREGDAPVSVAETHMRYMPCGADQGQERAEQARTQAFHRQGLATLTYLREAVCREYTDAFSRGVFLRRPDGSTYTFDAFVGGAVKPVAIIDFDSEGADEFYASLLDRATSNGYDGWMEDYGEYVPPDAFSASGLFGSRLHNLYPVLYHRSGMRYARASERPLVRFVRSGWTRVHRHAQVVWGGDPATGWGFDGLRSSVTQALTMGLSGISLWGSDVGGFFTLSQERLTPELLTRWIQFGAVSGVMRTKAEGIGAGQAGRPQIWQPELLPVWRRWAKLRTQLYPYLVAADRRYRRNGMPLMRHLALAYPRDRRATATDDAFLFGPDLLAAPVLEPGARRRRLYVPRGRWVDLWRSLRFVKDSGALRMRRARLLRGGRRVILPAPLSELPLLARAGTMLPLLPADVDTLADYGATAPGLVNLRDRRGRLRLLAFPRGRSSARFGERGRLRSVERRGAWRLEIESPSRVRIHVQASLASLRRPFVPARVLAGGRRLPRSRWSYDRGTNTIRVEMPSWRSPLRVTP